MSDPRITVEAVGAAQVPPCDIDCISPGHSKYCRNAPGRSTCEHQWDDIEPGHVHSAIQCRHCGLVV